MFMEPKQMNHSPPRPRRTAVGFAVTGSIIVGAAAMFGALTLVNGDLPLPRAVPTPTTSITPRPLPRSAWAESTATAMPVSVIAPGSVLAIGDSGQVELALGGGLSALVSITPGAPVAAPESDLAVLRKVTPQLAGMSVYYLPLRVTKVAGDSLAGVELGTVIFGVTVSRVPLQRLTIVDWRACSGDPIPATIDDPGAEVTLCFAAATADATKPAVGVEFSQPGGPYEAGLGTAVSWLP